MPRSQIEKDIKKLLDRKYNYRDCGVSRQDTELVETAIKWRAQKSKSIKISDQNIKSLSKQISTISENITIARLRCMEKHVKLKKEPEPLPHLTALNKLLNGTKISPPQEITLTIIHNHIAEDDKVTSTTTKIIADLNITSQISKLLQQMEKIQTENKTCTPPESASTNITVQNAMNTAGAVIYSCLPSRTMGGVTAVAATAVTTIAYNLSYFESTEEGEPSLPSLGLFSAKVALGSYLASRAVERSRAAAAGLFAVACTAGYCYFKRIEEDEPHLSSLELLSVCTVTSAVLTTASDNALGYLTSARKGAAHKTE